MAGLLDWITGAVKQQYAQGAPYREAIGGLLQGDPTKFGLLAQEFNRKAQTPEGALDVALNFAPLGITAWHGSPYQFTKFDPAKIGTGEGAQAYGHGLYFAESPDVAMSYKDKLSSGVTLNDKFIDDAMINSAKDKITANVLQKLKNAGEVSNSPFSDVMQSASKEELNVLKQLKPNLKTGSQTGSLYKVDIADKAIPKMLDWDAPLSKQPLNVQKALAKLDPDMYSKKGSDYDAMETGQSIYARISKNLSNEKELIKQRDALFNKYQKEGMTLSDAVRAMTPEDRATFTSIAQGIDNAKNAQAMASKYLLESGIPGIRYLDQGSRGAGKGTSNYVVFDPNTIQILERNGLLVP